MECVFDRNFHFLNKTDCGDDSEISGREKQSRNLRCAPSDVGGNVWSPDVEGKRDIYTVFGNGHQIHDLSQKERYKVKGTLVSFTLRVTTWRLSANVT